MMARILLVDDAVSYSEHLQERLTGAGHQVTTLSSPTALDALDFDCRAFDLAAVDLSFDGEILGVGVLLALLDRSPATRLVILTQLDTSAVRPLRWAVQLLPLRAVLTKNQPTASIVESITRALTSETTELDALLSTRLSLRKSPHVTLENFAKVIESAGHARVLQYLTSVDFEPTHRDIAEATHLAPTTVNNYRAQLSARISDVLAQPNSSIRDLWLFARDAAPFLKPIISRKLANG